MFRLVDCKVSFPTRQIPKLGWWPARLAYPKHQYLTTQIANRSIEDLSPTNRSYIVLGKDVVLGSIC